MSFERVANPFVVDMNAPRISLPLGLGLGLGRLVTVVSTTGRRREGQPIYWAAAAAGVVQPRHRRVQPAAAGDRGVGAGGARRSPGGQGTVLCPADALLEVGDKYEDNDMQTDGRAM